MAIVPETVYRHRVALIEEFGFTAMQVPEDGFTDVYLDVVGNHLNGDQSRHLILESNAILRTRIYWPDEATRIRAAHAMDDDFRETVGQAAYDRIHELKTLTLGS